MNFKITKQQQQLHIRESGIELLRIISIFFVVVIHSAPYFLQTSDGLTSLIIKIISWPAIFSFSFISGYFLIIKNCDGKKTNKFLWLTLELVIWRILISFIYWTVLSISQKYSFKDFLFTLPIILTDLVDVNFWYFWAILFVYLIFPFISSYLQQNYQTGKIMFTFLTCLLLFFSLLATINKLSFNFFYYSDDYTLVVVFTSACFGGLWHLFEIEKNINYTYKMQLSGVMLLLGCYLINFSISWWGENMSAGLSYLNIFWYFTGFSYFLLFKGIDLDSKFINNWAMLSWPIYVIHNNSFFFTKNMSS